MITCKILVNFKLLMIKMQIKGWFRAYVCLLSLIKRLFLFVWSHVPISQLLILSYHAYNQSASPALLPLNGTKNKKKSLEMDVHNDAL